MLKYKYSFKIYTAALVCILGCSTPDGGGYNLSNTFRGERLLGEGINRVFVHDVYNKGVEKEIKDIISSTLIRKINLDKKLAVVKNPEDSDLIVKLYIREFSKKTVKYSLSGSAEEIKLRIDSFVWVISGKTGEERVRKKRVEADQIYSETVPPLMSGFNAVNLLTDRLAERIVLVITTGSYPDK